MSCYTLLCRFFFLEFCPSNCQRPNWQVCDWVTNNNWIITLNNLWGCACLAGTAINMHMYCRYSSAGGVNWNMSMKLQNRCQECKLQTAVETNSWEACLNRATVLNWAYLQKSLRAQLASFLSLNPTVSQQPSSRSQVHHAPCMRYMYMCMMYMCMVWLLSTQT